METTAGAIRGVTSIVSKTVPQTTTGVQAVRLTRQTIADGLPRRLARAIDRFEPLPFDAAHDAITWLRHCVAEKEDPMLTILALDAKDRLRGFFVLGYTTFKLAPGDQPIVQVAKRLEDPQAPQIAAEIAWIARSRHTEKGFGRDLFDYAVRLAIDDGAIAMIVTPHDERTAKKLWIDRYRFRPPRLGQTGAGLDPRKLWFPVFKYEASWPS